ATSRVVLSGDRLEWWERGFDAQGKQVMGAIKGPSLFVKRSHEPPAVAAPVATPTADPRTSPAHLATPPAEVAATPTRGPLMTATAVPAATGFPVPSLTVRG